MPSPKVSRGLSYPSPTQPTNASSRGSQCAESVQMCCPENLRGSVLSLKFTTFGSTKPLVVAEEQKPRKGSRCTSRHKPRHLHGGQDGATMSSLSRDTCGSMGIEETWRQPLFPSRSSSPCVGEGSIVNLSRARRLQKLHLNQPARHGTIPSFRSSVDEMEIQ